MKHFTTVICSTVVFLSIVNLLLDFGVSHCLSQWNFIIYGAVSFACNVVELLWFVHTGKNSNNKKEVPFSKTFEFSKRYLIAYIGLLLFVIVPILPYLRLIVRLDKKRSGNSNLLYTLRSIAQSMTIILNPALNNIGYYTDFPFLTGIICNECYKESKWHTNMAYSMEFVKHFALRYDFDLFFLQSVVKLPFLCTLTIILCLINPNVIDNHKIVLISLLIKLIFLAVLWSVVIFLFFSVIGIKSRCISVIIMISDVARHLFTLFSVCYVIFICWKQNDNYYFVGLIKYAFYPSILTTILILVLGVVKLKHEIMETFQRANLMAENESYLATFINLTFYSN